jgi:hypothetical protein
MPTKRTFDLIIITVLLVHPAVGLLRMSARRWNAENEGPLGIVGGAVEAAL